MVDHALVRPICDRKNVGRYLRKIQSKRTQILKWKNVEKLNSDLISPLAKIDLDGGGGVDGEPVVIKIFIIYHTSYIAYHISYIIYCMIYIIIYIVCGKPLVRVDRHAEEARVGVDKLTHIS